MKNYSLGAIEFVIIGMFLILGVIGLHENFQIFERINFNGELKLSDIFTILFTFTLVVFAFLTYRHNTSTAELNKKMVELNERYVWLTGAMESHSQIMLDLKADELDIPIIKWDPNYEKFDGELDEGNEHRKVHVIKVIQTAIAKKNRVEGSKETAKDSEPLDMGKIYSEYYKEKFKRNIYSGTIKNIERVIADKEVKEIIKKGDKKQASQEAE